MIRKFSKKITTLIMALSMVLSYIIPITTVFAATNRTFDLKANGMEARIVFTQSPQDDSQDFGEKFIDDNNHVIFNSSQEQEATRYNQDLYVIVEPALDLLNLNHSYEITSVKINNVEQIVQFPNGRNTYDIGSSTDVSVEVTGVSINKYNIMWANDGANVDGTDFNDPEVLLKNGSAKIIKVYDNVTDMNDISNQIEHIEEGCLDPYDRGYVSLSEGNVVIFEFTPKYGYQLTSVSANGTKLEPQETMNQYKYIMPATNIHFQATFTKTSDIVKSSTTKVTSGTVKIGSTEINAGSTVLSVKDATLSDKQKSTFTSKAGDYKVSNILDIKLNQVFYKGSTDSNNVWSKPLGYTEDLKTPAIITLKLDEGVDGNSVVLIHEKEDGTYEVIETTYDESTHTISFSTASFSNYAIAAKTVVKNPQTYDGIISWIILSIISVSGIVGIITYRKKQNI